jgi:hypothetical protein
MSIFDLEAVRGFYYNSDERTRKIFWKDVLGVDYEG